MHYSGRELSGGLGVLLKISGCTLFLVNVQAEAQCNSKAFYCLLDIVIPVSKYQAHQDASVKDLTKSLDTRAEIYHQVSTEPNTKGSQKYTALICQRILFSTFRHTLFCYVSHADNSFFFLHLESLWQPYIEQVYRAIFQQHLLILRLCVPLW